jgi:hypothetical protein
MERKELVQLPIDDNHKIGSSYCKTEVLDKNVGISITNNLKYT